MLITKFLVNVQCPVQLKTEIVFALFSIKFIILESESRGNFQKKPSNAIISLLILEVLLLIINLLCSLQAY